MVRYFMFMAIIVFLMPNYSFGRDGKIGRDTSPILSGGDPNVAPSKNEIPTRNYPNGEGSIPFQIPWLPPPSSIPKFQIINPINTVITFYVQYNKSPWYRYQIFPGRDIVLQWVYGTRISILTDNPNGNPFECTSNIKNATRYLVNYYGYWCLREVR